MPRWSIRILTTRKGKDYLISFNHYIDIFVDYPPTFVITIYTLCLYVYPGQTIKSDDFKTSNNLCLIVYFYSTGFGYKIFIYFFCWLTNKHHLNINFKVNFKFTKTTTTKNKQQSNKKPNQGQMKTNSLLLLQFYIRIIKSNKAQRKFLMFRLLRFYFFYSFEKTSSIRHRVIAIARSDSSLIWS